MGIAEAGFRTARAAVFTALCVALSAGAHVLLSGTPVPPVTLVAVSAGVFLLAFALADRERGYFRIAALLIPLELFADTVFTTGQHACYGQAGGPVTGPLRSVGIDFVCAGGDFGTPLAQMAHGGSSLPLQAAAPAGSPWLLLSAHVAVGLLAAAWLRRGEAAVARLLRAAAATAFRPLLLAVATCRTSAADGPPAGTARALPVRTARKFPLIRHSVLRRGPPYALATAA
ncbi:hypothetical protein DVA86_08405 [Streptomyces armeniacus]|uniref:Integral membrane protein n=1 Tax=Streptomyces armeniacus TaxID=83291 RepID=A0A345XLZ7_9ACTN|nr:hypothetical protein [Streptomyces armeniacus]AXK32663.1 hypothetical protein DVA86_08405 [Streptomyces armeniacus]